MRLKIISGQSDLELNWYITREGSVFHDLLKPVAQVGSRCNLIIDQMSAVVFCFFETYQNWEMVEPWQAFPCWEN